MHAFLYNFYSAKKTINFIFGKFRHQNLFVSWFLFWQPLAIVTSDLFCGQESMLSRLRSSWTLIFRWTHLITQTMTHTCTALGGLVDSASMALRSTW